MFYDQHHSTEVEEAYVYHEKYSLISIVTYSTIVETNGYSAGSIQLLFVILQCL
jgi:hypothetical protein